jgi:hypothetical protein
MWLLFVGKYETKPLLKTNHTSRKLGVQNQTTRQEFLIFNSMYTIYQDGGYIQNLLFYVVNLYYRNVTQRVVNAGSEWDSQSHVHPAEKMVNTKGVPPVTVLALGSSFTRGQTNYRPISLLTSFSKIIEKLLYNRYHYFTQYKLFAREQHGFRQNNSTDTAAFSLLNIIFSFLEQKKLVGGLFLDL